MKVFKIGGNVIDNKALLEKFLKDFSKVEGPKILVHGGGKLATKLANDIGVEVKMIDGRRITDDAMLDVVTMVYAGLINKNVVAKLQSHSINAIGLSGADANVIQAKRRVHPTIDYGNVGDIEKVNAKSLIDFSKLGICPVLSAITHDNKGNLLNTNADTIAAEIAKACSEYEETELIYVFELDGVLVDINDSSSLIEEIDFGKYEQLKSKGIIAGGMIPKLDNSFEAINNGVKLVRITNPNYVSDLTQKHTVLKK